MRISDTRTYRAWHEMKRRCYDSKRHNHKWYGGRGITVCVEWMSSFETFLRDMGECPPKLTLDRIDGNGNYEPGNCRWITIQEQQSNRRTTIKVTLGGVTRSVAQWARLNGICRHLAISRINRGWTPEQAVTRPVGKFSKRAMRGCASQWKGVTRSTNGRWRAMIGINGKHKWIGVFVDECDAAQAYNFAADEAFGEFAALNSPVLVLTEQTTYGLR